ncbi:hypothetical protein OAF13_02430 [Akkermansiaceae bacterium]|nr:hypothetical protein [Akkermansiaceae bacterium]
MESVSRRQEWNQGLVRVVTNSNPKMANILKALISIFLGGAIYVLWRPDSLLMFSWFDLLGIGRQIDWMRGAASGVEMGIPEWAIKSLPQALWFFGGNLMIISIWRAELRFGRLIWLLVLWGFAISLELGQAVAIVPGSYDHTDLLLLIIFGAAALILSTKSNYEEPTRHN